MGAVSNFGYAQGMRKRTVLPAPMVAKPPARRPRKPPTRARTYPNRLHEITRAKGVTYTALGDMVGAHEVTIANLATGKQKLTQDWMVRLAKALGVLPEELIAKAAGTNLRRIRVRGALQAGDWAEQHEWADDDQFDVMIPDERDLRDIALYAGQIVGESMNQRFPSGSVVVLSQVGQRPGEIAVGKRYHVRTTRLDGRTEETIKTLVVDEAGRFWLKPESSAPEHQEWIPLDGRPDATVELLGRVRYVVHREI